MSGSPATAPSPVQAVPAIGTTHPRPPDPRDDLLVLLLQEALQLLGPTAPRAWPNGSARSTPDARRPDVPGDSQRSLRTAMHAIADTLTAHGSPPMPRPGGHDAVVADHCPFGSAASQYPVLCAVDRGMVKACWPACARERVEAPSRWCSRRPAPAATRPAPPSSDRRALGPHYLDHASSTPVRPPRWPPSRTARTGPYGDRPAPHRRAHGARRLEDARDQVAGCSGSAPARSSSRPGHEAVNAAAWGRPGRPGPVVLAEVEHSRP